MSAATATVSSDFAGGDCGQLDVRAGDVVEVVDDTLAADWRMVYCPRRHVIGYVPAAVLSAPQPRPPPSPWMPPETSEERCTSVTDSPALSAQSSDAKGETERAFVRVYAGSWAPGDTRGSYRTLAFSETRSFAALCATAKSVFCMDDECVLILAHHETGRVALRSDTHGSLSLGCVMEVAKALTAASNTKRHQRYWKRRGKAVKAVLGGILIHGETHTNAAALLAKSAEITARDAKSDFLTAYRVVLERPAAPIFLQVRTPGGIEFVAVTLDAKVRDMLNGLPSAEKFTALALVPPADVIPAQLTTSDAIWAASTALPADLSISAVLRLAPDIEPTALLFLAR